MKYYQFIIVMLFAAFMIIMTGCEYDVKNPLWEEPYSYPPETRITELEPESVAPAGVNYITIYGENFSDTLARNHVYFGYLDENDNEVVVGAEIVDGSTTWLKVRRPNISHNAVTVKLVSEDAVLVATYPPKDSILYQIDPVMERYGSFVENNTLRAIDVDEDENLYVYQINPNIIYKIPLDGEKEILREIGGIAYDMKIGPDDKLVVVTGSTTINQIDLATKDSTKFAETPKTVRYGDFDSYGNFYMVSNSRSDLYMVIPGDTLATSLGYYNDNFFDVEVFHDGINEYIYLSVELRSPGANEPVIGIWRRPILDGNGLLGEKELVLDWSTTGASEEFSPVTFTVVKDADGTVVYIGTANTDPVYMFDPDNGIVDILYKGIIPTEAVHLVHGTINNYIYMLLGGDEDNILRIDMGNR